MVLYLITDDRRREDVITLLSGYGLRVQLSVFECELRSRREAAALRAKPPGRFWQVSLMVARVSYWHDDGRAPVPLNGGVQSHPM
jgi:hypothetical protein